MPLSRAARQEGRFRLAAFRRGDLPYAEQHSPALCFQTHKPRLMCVYSRGREVGAEQVSGVGSHPHSSPQGPFMKTGIFTRFNPARVFAYGTLSAAVAVALGAFGAHSLRDALTPAELATYETAVRYQIYHSLALIAAGLGGRVWAPKTPRNFVSAGWCFAVGTVLFSGSLYALSLSGPLWVAYFTPFGGTLFLAGWIFLFTAVLKDCRTASRPDLS